jgi:sec-independent protein translocase protein TatA
MSIGAPQILLVILLLILLFGRGRISSLMGEIAKGIKSFQSGLRDEDRDQLDQSPSDVIDVPKSKEENNDKTNS